MDVVNKLLLLSVDLLLLVGHGFVQLLLVVTLQFFLVVPLLHD